MLEFITKPWAWYVTGSVIGLLVPLLLLLGNKSFGISSSLRHVCASCVPANISFFKYDWKKEKWNLFFVAGIFLGGLFAQVFLKNPLPIEVSEATKSYLATYQITDYNNLLPSEIFSFEALFTLRGFVFMVFGGFLVGFGTRYAGGCTSGHAIMGLSNLQLPSLIAVVSFMIGGFLMTWFLLPILLNL
jgi:uncharacterized membrane protein YedE/YeeE